jgi:D-glycero-alpha-D-manno-heptose-7-phosphate kinase
MEITVTVPNRIDLAGGTTDIYPLYLLMGGGCTANVAVNVSSRVVLKSRREPGIAVISEDLGSMVEAPTPDALPITGPLGLLARVVQALPPRSGLELRARNSAPRGSGLGASSALVVAAISGLLELRGEGEAPSEIVRLAASIETAAIGVPTGKQDYIAAVFGGVSLLTFGYQDFSRRAVPTEIGVDDALAQTVILSYTGQGRFSGMNNWDITKAFIDGNGEVREKLIRIRDVALDVCSALEEGSLREVPKLVAEEWAVRRTLAPGVSTPRIEVIIDAARRAGGLASKICGAGGGGCMITFVEPDRRTAVQRAIQGAGGTVMSFAVDGTGVAVECRP